MNITEDEVADAISDSLDADWTPGDGARAVMKLLSKRIAKPYPATAALLASEHAASIQNPYRFPDSQGVPYLYYSMQHVTDAFKAGMQAATSDGELYGKWHRMLLALVNTIHNDWGEKTGVLGLNLSYQQALAKVSPARASVSGDQ